MLKKSANSIKTLIFGLLCLIGTLLMYSFLPIDDVLNVILMSFSIIIIIYGIFLLVRDYLQ